MDNRSRSFEEERIHILRMVEQGEINASEAVSLLSALSREKETGSDTSGPNTPEPPLSPESTVEPAFDAGQPVCPSPRWFRIRVTDLSSGRSKVTVNLPIGLVNWGMKMGARFSPEVSEFDFNGLSQALQSGAEGKLIDVVDDEDGEHVEIFID